MREIDVGSLPVCHNGRPIGTLTARDIVIRVVATDCDPRATRVQDVMSPDLVHV